MKKSAEIASKVAKEALGEVGEKGITELAEATSKTINRTASKQAVKSSSKIAKKASQEVGENLGKVASRAEDYYKKAESLDFIKASRKYDNSSKSLAQEYKGLKYDQSKMKKVAEEIREEATSGARATKKLETASKAENYYKKTESADFIRSSRKYDSNSKTLAQDYKGLKYDQEDMEKVAQEIREEVTSNPKTTNKTVGDASKVRSEGVNPKRKNTGGIYDWKSERIDEQIKSLRNDKSPEMKDLLKKEMNTSSYEDALPQKIRQLNQQKENITISDKAMYNKVPQKVAAGGMTAWMVSNMSDRRGKQSNAELYGQDTPYR